MSQTKRKYGNQQPAKVIREAESPIMKKRMSTNSKIEEKLRMMKMDKEFSL
tara:strand:- start:2391 stop:2543 length:153 start_codon:yes stop_codon:yes gene_type:complete